MKPKILEYLHHFTSLMKEKIHRITQSQRQKLVRFLIEKVTRFKRRKGQNGCSMPIDGKEAGLKGGLLSMAC